MAPTILTRPLTVLSLIAWVFCAVTAAAHVEVVQGTAYDAEGRLAYRERHTLTYKDGRVVRIKTIYTDANNVKIGELDSDFSHNEELGNYDFYDQRQRYQDGARVYDDRIAVFYRPAPREDLRLIYLPRNGNQILGQGFKLFLNNRLKAIAAGERIRAKLVVPAKQDQFDVVVEKVKLAGNRLLLRVDVDSWFLKLFVPHIEAEFDLENKRLIAYRGVSMVADEMGKTTSVTVRYDYPGRSTVAQTQ